VSCCRAGRQIQLYLEFQAAKQLEAQQRAQLLAGTAAGREAAATGSAGQNPAAPSSSSKQQQQQQQQQPSKPGTLQSFWGIIKRLSPAKGSRVNPELSTQQQQQ
jgi:hypothetical protein